MLFTNVYRQCFSVCVAVGLSLCMPDVHAKPKTMTKAEIIAEAETMALKKFDHMKWDFRHRSWLHGAFWAGVIDLANVSNSKKIDEALKKVALSRGVRNVGMGVLERHSHGKNHTDDPFHADDFCMGQTFLDYSIKHNDPKVAKDTVRRVGEASDHMLSEKANKNAAQFETLPTHDGLTWSWIDALFMAAPLHARLSESTGDPKHLNAMLVEWKRVSDNLYDKNEHLYFRDKDYLTKKSRHGKKVFWARGNGWVMGAFARTLPYIPKDRPERKWLVEQFQEMSTKLASIQQPDGSWCPSLIDYRHFPYSEMSGTAFYCFAMAWGINNGILEEKKFRPVVEKAWSAMLTAKTKEGFLGYIQGVGAGPAGVQSKTWNYYGNGAFFMAAVELSKMAPITLKTLPSLVPKPKS